jgi:hypothetical protein
MVSVPALGLCIGLGHISSSLGRAVVLAAIAVVHVAGGVQPYQARTTTRRRSLARCLGRRRGGLCRRGRRSSRGRRWCRSRSSGSSLRCRCSSSRSSGSGRSGRVPLLHTLVSTARPLFAGGRRVSPVFTLTCRSGRRLGQRNMRHQKPCRNRHQTNRCLHKLSR